MFFRPILLAAALSASGAHAQSAPPPAPTPVPAPAPAPATVRVALETDQGRIVLELEKERAPITTANFLRYVDQKRLDGIGFYRTVKVAPAFGFVQFGVQYAPKRVLPPITEGRAERVAAATRKHADGRVRFHGKGGRGGSIHGATSATRRYPRRGTLAMYTGSFALSPSTRRNAATAW